MADVAYTVALWRAVVTRVRKGRRLRFDASRYVLGMRQRMNEGSQNMLRKRPLKAKRAVAIAKAAGRNQLAQTKSRVLEGGSSGRLELY